MDAIGNHLTILHETPSTNNYAAACIDDGSAKHGSAYLALLQTAGKGQRGNVWHGGIGNIALSVVLQTHFLALSQAFTLQMMVAYTVAYTLNQHQSGFTIKWPNDIYFNDRKAAGILIENKIKGNHWQYAVVGIGINVNQKQVTALSPNAIAMMDILGRQLDVVKLTQQLLQNMQYSWEQYLQYPQWAADMYNELLYKKHQIITLLYNNKVERTMVQKVSTDGSLVCGENNDYQFKHGEVEWLIHQ
jgi:BirA family biotin operon repressor/biotin-[acetyl-CoA-carboxylase] ligase